MSSRSAADSWVAGTAADECKKLPLHWEPISLTDDDEKPMSTTVLLAERPRRDFAMTCMRVATILVFVAILSTLMFIALRFFVLLEERAELVAHQRYMTNRDAQADSDYQSASDAETGSFELIFSTLMRAMEEDSTKHRHPVNKRRESTNFGRHHRARAGLAGHEPVNEEEEEVASEEHKNKSAQSDLAASDLEKHSGSELSDGDGDGDGEVRHAKSAQNDSQLSVTTDLSEQSEQSEESGSESESFSSKPKVWGFVHKNAVRIVNGRVVSNWDQMIQFGPSDESQPDAQIGTAPSETGETGETAVALVQPSKTSGRETQVQSARGKRGRGGKGGNHWRKRLIGGREDSSDASGDEDSSREHGRWPDVRDWMSERLGKFRGWFSSMMD